MSLRQRRFHNRSSIALKECGDFIRTPGGCEYKQVKAQKGRGIANAETSGARANHGDRVTGDALCNTAMISLGRPRFDRVDVHESPEDVFGSLAWRIREHQRTSRRRDSIWG